MNFIPECSPTAIGSFPFKEPETTVKKIFEKLPEIPVWPQLPNVNFRENMYIQYSEGMPCAVIDDKKELLYFETSGDIFEKLEVFYEKYMEKDLEYFRISPEYSSGFFAFENYLNSNDLSTVKYLKCHITGPVSFGMTVTDENKRSAFYNEALVDAIVKCCAMKAAWQLNRLKKFNKELIMFIDEPYLSAFGSAFVNVSREQVITYINEIVETIHEYGAAAGVHCCGNTDWSILMDSNIDIISFDAYDYFQSMTLYPDHLKKFFSRGGVLAWGIIPTSAKIENENTDSIIKNFEEKVALLSEKGFTKNEILDRCLITPSCGMGSLSAALSDKVLEILSAVSAELKRRRK
ncbi:hypothetical protein ACFL4T_05735 [candidate division KSB1 bacterium]